jgi:hypothetical protein
VSDVASREGGNPDHGLIYFFSNRKEKKKNEPEGTGSTSLSDPRLKLNLPLLRLCKITTSSKISPATPSTSELFLLG